MNGLALEDLFASATVAEAELFGDVPALKEMRNAARLQDAQRRALAVSVAGVANTPDGLRLFEYLATNYIRRFENVTSLGLPMETAIQLHAARDGARALVQDLLKLVNEGNTKEEST